MANVRHHSGSRSNEQAVSLPSNLVSATPCGQKLAAMLSWVTGGLEKMHRGLAGAFPFCRVKCQQFSSAMFCASSKRGTISATCGILTTV